MSDSNASPDCASSSANPGIPSVSGSEPGASPVVSTAAAPESPEVPRLRTKPSSGSSKGKKKKSATRAVASGFASLRSYNLYTLKGGSPPPVPLEVCLGDYLPKLPKSTSSKTQSEGVNFVRSTISEQALLTALSDKEFDWPKDTSFATSVHLRAHHRMRGGFCLYAETIKAGFRYPLPAFIIELLNQLGVAPSQLTPNSWRTMIGFLVACRRAGIAPSVRLFFVGFTIKPSGDWVYFLSRSKETSLVQTPSSIHGWKKNFFFVYCPGGWPFPSSWSATQPTPSFVKPRTITQGERELYSMLVAIKEAELLRPSEELIRWVTDLEGR